MALTQTQVSELYVAVFGRASEGEGNTYWATYETTESAATEMFTLDVVSNYFSVSNFTEEANVRTVVEAIYLNALGKAPADDVAGIQYWVDSIIVDGNAMGVMVAGLVASANDPVNAGAAQDTFNNKVAVSNYTADTVETFTDFATFQGFIASVDETSASVDAAKTSIDGSSTFSLTTGLADVEVAEDALDAFLLATAQTDAAGEEAALTPTQVDNRASTATGAVDTIVVNDGTYTAASVAVKAAMLSDATASLAETLAAKVVLQTAAQEAVTAIDGLPEAITALENATAADDAAIAAAAAAVVAENAAIAAWDVSAVGGNVDVADNTTNALKVTVNDPAASLLTPFADNIVLTLTEIDGTTTVVSMITATDVVVDGTNTLAELTAEQVAYYEAQQAIAADYVAAINANIAANAAAVATGTAKVDAQDAVDVLDLTAAAKADKLLIGAAIENGGGDVVSVAAPTDAEIADYASDFMDADVTDTLVAANASDTENDGATSKTITAGTIAVAADGTITATIEGAPAASVATNIGGTITINAGLTTPDATITALIAAVQARENFDLLQSDFASSANTNDVVDAAGTADDNVETAQDAVDALAEAAAAEVAADAAVATKDDLEAAVTAADKVITDEGYVTPVMLDGNKAATAGDDVFLLDVDGVSISAFGDAGSDALYIGSGFTLNADETAEANGDDAVLEVWLTETGGSTVISVEETAFGSSSAADEVNTITLTGVPLADVSLVDGLITVA